MRKLVLVAATAATLAAVPAAAQVGGPFTGPRVEGLIGYDNIQDGDDGSDDGRDGVTYGGAIGYDIGLGAQGIVGAEAELTDSSVRVGDRDVLTAGDRLRVNVGRDIFLGARAGYVISPVAMVYAKGGYTNTRVEARYNAGTTTVAENTDLEGFRVGAGLEYNMSGSTYIKGEYRYSHYGDLDGFDIDADRHQLMAGVGIRF